MNARASCVWLSLSMLALVSCAVGGDDPAVISPEVEVALPVASEVTDTHDFLGRTESSATVQLKSRVTGYLERVLFPDGAEVKKGDVLFEIDSRPYKLGLAKADAALVLAEAHFKRADADLKRTRALADRGTVSREEMDRATAERDEAVARIRLAKAERDILALNLDYTRVHAPFAGRIGRRKLDVGALVRADETDLGTLSASGPIYVRFNIDERTALALRRQKAKGLPVAMGLADEKGFPRQAEVDSVAAGLTPATGTLGLRATLPNADGLLVPGLSVRVRLTIGKPYKALTMPYRAVNRELSMAGRPSGEGKGVVLVVNDRDEIEVREIQLGARTGDMVVVKEGLKATDRIVLARQRPLQAGTKVKPKLTEIPSEKK